MTFKIFNTLTRKKEVFKPLKDKHIRLYTCGPTVYDYAHIGNFRTYVWQDLLKRWLIHQGFKITHVMNLTDVDDKTIKGSRKEGIPLQQFTERYAEAFFEDMKRLNILPADVFPRATEHIKEQVGIIKSLLKKGIAYKGEDGSIYYNVRKFKNYGKLSKLKIKQLKAGTRVKQDTYEKEQANDFALWKAWDTEDGDVFWQTEIGKGRPGWHIECSAMSTKYLGIPFDMHTGGIDLIFPHHENEIAQSEGAFGKKFVKYWVHAEWLMVEGKKMSKSLGNFYTLRDLLNQGYDSRAIRYILLSTHYKQNLNFTFEGLRAAQKTVDGLIDFLKRVDEAKGRENKKVSGLIKKTWKKFEEAMNDNLRINDALAAVFDLERQVNKMIGEGTFEKNNAKEVNGFFFKVDEILGLNLKEAVKREIVPVEVELMVKKREEARRHGDFKTADELREKIKKAGYSVEDTEKGVRIKKIKK